MPKLTPVDRKLAIRTENVGIKKACLTNETFAKKVHGAKFSRHKASVYDTRQVRQQPNTHGFYAQWLTENTVLSSKETNNRHHPPVILKQLDFVDYL